jgi:hypothetical protein
MMGYLLSDSINGTVSSKRVITLLAFILCAISMISEQFFNYKLNSAAFESMMYIVIAGLGFTASEKFAPSKKGKENG